MTRQSTEKFELILNQPVFPLRLIRPDATQIMNIIECLTGPEVHEVLLFHGSHLLHDRPEPTLEVDQPVGALPGLVVERRVADQSLDVDITDLRGRKRNVSKKSGN